MKKSIYMKLEGLAERQEEIQALLSDPSVISNQDKFRALSKEFSELDSVTSVFADYQSAEADFAAAEDMLKDNDPDMREMAQEEYKATKMALEQLSQDLEILMLPKDLNDSRNCYLEIRAGAGGDEAAIFAGDLFRMYSRYAEMRKWTVTVVSAHDGEHGGYKEIVLHIDGDNVFSQLKFESGGHRVQRVPETESQGRVHTSACTVAILPEIPEAEAVVINAGDLRVDTFRASGAGGQHVNKTDSAIRLTHIPTGIVVECQAERSQHKNRAKAMSMLASRIQSGVDEKRRLEEETTRRSLVGSGDRSERIRTYNYPQGRLSEHRINLTLYKLAEVMEGDLDCIIKPLTVEYQADLLAAMAQG